MLANWRDRTKEVESTKHLLINTIELMFNVENKSDLYALHHTAIKDMEMIYQYNLSRTVGYDDGICPECGEAMQLMNHDEESNPIYWCSECEEAPY
ncbi:hypothetical protein [Fusibacter sp. JL216-2]|uniref:hypothetical protein n=1 Tax=Fusibacter sp. JL216-2 TaxID=3071453 RepID=UPI003D3305CB